MMWCYQAHSSKISWDCGATLKHPGLFECEDSSLKHQQLHVQQHSISSQHTCISVSCMIYKITIFWLTYAQKGLIQRQHGSLGPHDTLFCNNKGSMTELQIEQTS